MGVDLVGLKWIVVFGHIHHSQRSEEEKLDHQILLLTLGA